MVSDTDILDALRRHDVIDVNNEEEIDEDVVELMWKLYLKIVKDKDAEISQLNQLLQAASTEKKHHDEITLLKQELIRLKKNATDEEEEVADMCRQEGLDELISSSRSDQMAYMLVLRTTLLEKLSVTQERTGKVIAKHEELENQLHALMHEDGEMRNRMNNAMCEMGSMAAKLNTAVMERDKLRQEVSQLSNILTSINQLPPKQTENIEVKNKILSLQSSVELYKTKLNDLQRNNDVMSRDHKKELMETMGEMEEMKELNEKLKEVNLQLSLEDSNANNKSLSAATDRDSQDLLKEMQTTLEEDEKRAALERQSNLKTISELESQNKSLESQVQNLEDLLVVAKSTEPPLQQMEMEQKQLQMQLAEAKRQIKELRAENLQNQEDSKRYQREFTKQEVAYSSKFAAFEEMEKTNQSLQLKNLELEKNLEKALSELDKVLKDSRMTIEEKESYEENTQIQNEKVEALVALNQDLQSQIDSQKMAEKHAIRLKDVEEKQRVQIGTLEEKLKEAYRSMEDEVAKKMRLLSEVDDLKSSLEDSERIRDKTMNETVQLKEKLVSNQDKLLLLTVPYEITNKDMEMLQSMKKPVLEDALYAVRVRLLSAMHKTEEYAQKYSSLKQKHKGKIRTIRDLFMMERRDTAEEIEKLELRVSLAESALDRELEWKNDVLNEVRRTHEDHRRSIEKESISTKLVNEKEQKINEMEEKCVSLGEENIKLLGQLQLMENQKYELEKILEQKQQKVELNTLLNDLSLTGSLNPKQPSDDVTEL